MAARRVAQHLARLGRPGWLSRRRGRRERLGELALEFLHTLNELLQRRLWRC
jgi:hypothetical protein